MSNKKIEKITYEDGGWCTIELVDGKYNGDRTFYYPNGKKRRKERFTDGRKEGYEYYWDEEGRLFEEIWYHMDEINGKYRKWDKTGKEIINRDYILGYEQEAFKNTVNIDFNRAIKPFYRLEPQEIAKNSKSIIDQLGLDSSRMSKSATESFQSMDSFWGYVNLMGLDEEWPKYNGHYLSPVLQIKCSDIPLQDHPLKDFSYITLFAAKGTTLSKLGGDIVIRCYKETSNLKIIDRCPAIQFEKPSKLDFCDPIICYPDENDLPSGLYIYLEDIDDKMGVLEQDILMDSHIGGWPGWIQENRVSDFYKFAFQIDTMDFENWKCGDSTIHYFFLNENLTDFSWRQDMF